jgi:hypothetical protein
MGKLKKLNRCYVYVYLDPRKPGVFTYGEYSFKQEPFYVGKGVDDRAWSHLKECRQAKNNNKQFINKLRKIQRNVGSPTILLYSENMLSDDAYLLEERMISTIGRLNTSTGPLCNIDGGGPKGIGIGVNNPNYGKHLSEEHKKKCSLPGSRNGMYGRKHTPETLKKISDALMGVPLSEETKRKISEGQKGENNQFYGKTHTDEQKKKWSEERSGPNHPWYGKHHSDETKQTISSKLKGIPKSEEAKKNMHETKQRKKLERLGPF